MPAVHYIGHVSKTYPNLAISACGTYSGPIMRVDRYDDIGEVTTPHTRWTAFNPEAKNTCLRCLKLSMNLECLDVTCRRGLAHR